MTSRFDVFAILDLASLLCGLPLYMCTAGLIFRRWHRFGGAFFYVFVLYVWNRYAAREVEWGGIHDHVILELGDVCLCFHIPILSTLA